MYVCVSVYVNICLCVHIYMLKYVRVCARLLMLAGCVDVSVRYAHGYNLDKSIEQASLHGHKTNIFE